MSFSFNSYFILCFRTCLLSFVSSASINEHRLGTLWPNRLDDWTLTTCNSLRSKLRKIRTQAQVFLLDAHANGGTDPEWVGALKVELVSDMFMAIMRKAFMKVIVYL